VIKSLQKMLGRSLALVALAGLSFSPFAGAYGQTSEGLGCTWWDGGCYCTWISTCSGDCLSTLPGTGCWHVEPE